VKHMVKLDRTEMLCCFISKGKKKMQQSQRELLVSLVIKKGHSFLIYM